MKKPGTGNVLANVLILSMTLAGCGGEFAYKRGASVNDLNEARKQCQSKGIQGDAFAQCMEESGWVFHNPMDGSGSDDEDPVIKASYNKDYRNTAAIAEPAAGVAAAPASNAESTSPPPPAKKPADPMDIFIVSSWWKAGRGAESLKEDIQQCVAKLGPEHQPDLSGRTAKATRGLLLCMKDLGWKALQAHE
ncbi:hypothetical protein LG198_01965 [Methylobacillus arboreus]|uniref:hypothetical protein n=1 Tax=Methylobacillus arboreus TaxID=755170 RepID=UPI001E314980|nr:hypothetical protein [Methylobacillus arboreus]MCB5189495.1 hypothetical protein [Methylobacillus arboreus]